MNFDKYMYCIKINSIILLVPLSAKDGRLYLVTVITVRTLVPSSSLQ